MELVYQWVVCIHILNIYVKTDFIVKNQGMVVNRAEEWVWGVSKVATVDHPLLSTQFQCRVFGIFPKYCSLYFKYEEVSQTNMSRQKCALDLIYYYYTLNVTWKYNRSSLCPARFFSSVHVASAVCNYGTRLYRLYAQ